MDKWNKLPLSHMLPETDEQRSERINRATKRMVVRLIDGQWDVEFDVKDGEMPITPRELGFLKQAVLLRHRHMLRTYSLSQRMNRPAPAPPVQQGVPVEGAEIRQDDQVLKSYLEQGA